VIARRPLRELDHKRGGRKFSKTRIGHGRERGKTTGTEESKGKKSQVDEKHQKKTTSWGLARTPEGRKKKEKTEGRKKKVKRGSSKREGFWDGKSEKKKKKGRRNDKGSNVKEKEGEGGAPKNQGRKKNSRPHLINSSTYWYVITEKGDSSKLLRTQSGHSERRRAENQKGKKLPKQVKKNKRLIMVGTKGIIKKKKTESENMKKALRRSAGPPPVLIKNGKVQKKTTKFHQGEGGN